MAVRGIGAGSSTGRCGRGRVRSDGRGTNPGIKFHTEPLPIVFIEIGKPHRLPYFFVIMSEAFRTAFVFEAVFCTTAYPQAANILIFIMEKKY